MPLTDDIKTRFKQRLTPLQPGEHLSIKLATVTFKDAASFARAFTGARKWCVSIEKTLDGIKISRLADGPRLPAGSGRWGLSAMAAGDSRDFELSPSEHQTLRNAVSTYANRTKKRFSVHRQGPTNFMRVKRLPDAKPEPEEPCAFHKVERKTGEWPFRMLRIGWWFFVPSSEKASARQISPMCSYHGKQLGRKFSVRKISMLEGEEVCGTYVIRTE